MSTCAPLSWSSGFHVWIVQRLGCRALTRGCMLSQQSKLRHSRNEWKQKAKERAEHNRYLRKELERMRNERDRAKQALKEAKERRGPPKARPADVMAEPVWVAGAQLAGDRIRLRGVSGALRLLAPRLGIGKEACPQAIINSVIRPAVVRMQAVRVLEGASRRLL